MADNKEDATIRIKSDTRSDLKEQFPDLSYDQAVQKLLEVKKRNLSKRYAQFYRQVTEAGTEKNIAGVFAKSAQEVYNLLYAGGTASQKNMANAILKLSDTVHANLALHTDDLHKIADKLKKEK